MEFRTDIAGLRAVAVLLVVLFHAGVGVIGGGYVGVDAFFVISGFLITSRLTQELVHSGRISLTRFYARRMVRLLPASIVVVVGALLATWHWASPLFAKAVAGDALASATYVVNVKLAVEGTQYLHAGAPPSPLQHFWSLAVEEQFYIIWPLLLMLSSMVWLRRGRPSIGAAAVVLSIIGAASLVLCLWQTGANQPWAYFGIQARAWELAVGALIALGAGKLATLDRRVAAGLTWLGLAGVVAAGLLYTEATRFPGYAALLPVAGAALVIAGGCAAPAAGARLLLRWTPLQEIGRLSYSWYLWHWPILILAPYVLGYQPSVWANVGLAAAALIPSAMSLTAVEDRIRFHRLFRRRVRHGLLLGSTLTLVTAGLAVFTMRLPDQAGHGTATDTAALLSQESGSATPPQLLDLIRASAAVTAMPANLVPPLATAGGDRPLAGRCLADLDKSSIASATAAGCENLGDVNGTATVVLFGDSHAEQWLDAVDAIARGQHWRLAVFAKGGCTPANALTYKGNTFQPYEECTQWRRSALERIAALRASVVVMSTRTYAGNPLNIGGPADQAWAKALVDTARQLTGAGAKVVLIADTPDLRQVNVPQCVSANPLNLVKCQLDKAKAVNTGRRSAASAALAAVNVRVIDPTPWFCTNTVCPAIIGNTLVYRDDSHVSATYVKVLAPVLTPLIAS